jgi:hypothetical protein
MYTKADQKCPFCYVAYREPEETKTRAEEKTKDKKGTEKTPKEFFKSWKDN